MLMDCLDMHNHAMAELGAIHQATPCDSSCDAVECCPITALAIAEPISLTFSPHYIDYLSKTTLVHSAYAFRLERPPRV
jgi:hypothetical protein